ncbi:MAG: class I SAM-dependent methyltransferase [Pirellulales bacterium]|nr:class I SAM-dependent methyltransferase [Pirellulales bacterium]
MKPQRILSRILEPEVMDTPAEARDYDSMDHREVNRRFVDDLLVAASLMASPINLLDLGAGTAQIPIELCRRSANIHITAVDASRHMLEMAKLNVERAGLSSQIRLEHADAKRLNFATDSFDAVISNSIIHHLPEPQMCLHEAVRVARPGGLLFFRDLIRPANQHKLEQLVNRYTPASGISIEADHQRAMFADSLRAALTLTEVEQLVAGLNLSASSMKKTSDRHWTWIARKNATVIGTM